ncbi:hypothetical protein H4R33_001451 [Dimargaris cristalligena]|nr:hypothetical protein H4R33_001451 [Dimargaris cristalligena]
MSPGEFVRRMNYLVHDPVQRYIFTRDQVNLQLKAAARKLQALADASGDMKDFEATIQQFTGDFYSLAKLESWSVFTNQLLNRYSGWESSYHRSLNQLGHPPPSWQMWHLDYPEFVSNNRANPLLKKENWRLLRLESLSSFALTQHFPLAYYANRTTLVVLERIHRVVSSHFPNSRDPPTTIKHHFGANLEITSHQMESLELTRSVLLPTLEMGFLLSVWRLYRREEIDHLVQFVQLVWNDTKVEKNGVQHIGHFLGNVIFFLLTLAAIDQKQSVLTALEPFFSTAAIYADDRRRFAQVFSVHQRKLVECLNNRGLANAARFLHQRWGLQINLDRTWTDASCWKSLFGSTWLAFTSTGELGVGVPVNLLDPAPRLDQFLPSEYQTTFPSFRSIDRIQNKLFQDDHPVFASAWFTLKHAVDVVRGLRRWGYED